MDQHVQMIENKAKAMISGYEVQYEVAGGGWPIRGRHVAWTLTANDEVGTGWQRRVIRGEMIGGQSLAAMGSKCMIGY
ncbi:hypothetical protein Tco_0502189 [Tanacetum coccineum]